MNLGVQIEKIKNCRRCSLAKTRRNIVMGRGAINSDLLYIGEGPGKTEDLRGTAFIGAAGKLLDQMNEDARIMDGYKLPHLNKYFTNIVLCHPTNTFAGENRAPKKEEVLACLPNVRSIIYLTNPKKLVLVGSTAKDFYKREYPDAAHIQHPAYLLRTGGKGSPHYWKNVRVLNEAFRSIISPDE